MKNDYNEYAKERQERLLNGMMPSHRFVEKPMMMSMMPNLKGKKVLMLGCGTGEESKFLKNFGVNSEDLVGIDISSKSIELAQESYPDIKFIVADMADLPFEDNTFKEFTHTFFSWDMNETLSFYVGPPSFHFKLLRKTNFSVLDFTESKAIEEAKDIDKNYYIKNKELPQFMAFLVKK